MQTFKYRTVKESDGDNMTDYICDDCDDGDGFTGNCKLSLPNIAGKPRYCPILDGREECKWKAVQ